MQKQWSCGCMEVDGQLVQQCSQVQPVGELTSDKRSLYSAECFRQTQEAPAQPESFVATPEHIDIPATEEAANGVQE